MKTKWVININGLENYRFAEDGNLYKISSENSNRRYQHRLIKMQYPNRWRLNGEWWSKNQLKPHLEQDLNPIVLYKMEPLPF